MSQELTDKTNCIQLRNGLEIWVNHEQSEKIEQCLIGNERPFIKVEGQVVNTKDIMAVLSADKADEHRHRKQGDKKCSYGVWHGRGEECGCRLLSSEVVRQEPHTTPTKGLKYLESVRKKLNKTL